jgi:hypothetical protein
MARSDGEITSKRGGAQPPPARAMSEDGELYGIEVWPNAPLPLWGLQDKMPGQCVLAASSPS